MQLFHILRLCLSPLYLFVPLLSAYSCLLPPHLLLVTTLPPPAFASFYVCFYLHRFLLHPLPSSYLSLPFFHSSALPGYLLRLLITLFLLPPTCFIHFLLTLFLYQPLHLLFLVILLTDIFKDSSSSKTHLFLLLLFLRLPPPPPPPPAWYKGSYCCFSRFLPCRCTPVCCLLGLFSQMVFPRSHFPARYAELLIILLSFFPFVPSFYSFYFWFFGCFVVQIITCLKFLSHLLIYF